MPEDAMRGHAAMAVRGATVVVACRDDGLALKVRQLNVGPHVTWIHARTSREVEDVLIPRDRLPHEADDGHVQVLVLSQDVDVSSTGEFVGELLRRRPSLKIIFIARHLEPGAELLVRQQGVYFVTAEPVEPTLLERVLTKALEHETTRLKKARGIS